MATPMQVEPRKWKASLQAISHDTAATQQIADWSHKVQELIYRNGAKDKDFFRERIKAILQNVIGSQPKEVERSQNEVARMFEKFLRFNPSKPFA